MKRTARFSIICICLLFAAATAQAGKLTLTFATDCSPGSMRADAEDMFLKEIETLSQGTIKVQRFWGSSLLQSKEILKGVQNNVVDLGMINPARYPKRLNYVSGAMVLPKGPVSYENKLAVFREIFELPKIKKQIESFGQKPLYLYTISYIGMAFNTKVEGFADFKDKRVRASARWFLNDIKALGGIPVSLPFSDVYMALQTKAIDGVFTNVDALHRGKICEVAPHLVVYKDLWTPVAFMININQKKYDRLSADQKDLLARAAANADKKFAPVYAQWMTRMIMEIEKGGAKISFGTPSDLALFLDSPAHKANERAWVSDLKKQGDDSGAELLSRMKQINNRIIKEEAGK